MLQKSNEQRVLEIFFTEPTKEHYLMNIARKTGLSHTSVTPALDALVDKRLIIKRVETRGERTFPLYKAHTQNSEFALHKQLSNMISLHQSGLIRAIQDAFMPSTIVVFGSYAKGEDHEESDIDIFIEAKQQHIDLSLFQTLLRRKIELHTYSDISSLSKELKSSIVNGIVLTGFLEVFS